MSSSPPEARWPCPVCRARVGQRCATPDGSPHAERVQLAHDPQVGGLEGKINAAIKRVKRGARAIPTAFESNRRRH